MSFELDEVLKRIDSSLLSKLRSFYRDYFSDDDSCIKFIYNCVKAEPIIQGLDFYEDEEQPGVFVLGNGETFSDDVFIPRRMLNSVERLVTVARDMDQIRREKDIFKIIFIVTCVETLQLLTGEYSSNDSKAKMLFSFFDEYTSIEDKEYISERFKLSDEDLISEEELINDGEQTTDEEQISDENLIKEEEDPFRQFIGVINEYRNCAAHEGNYWDYCFNNEAECDKHPLRLIVRIDLVDFKRENKKLHHFHTLISYREFEKIFVRTCISLITNYVEKHSVCS